ncbi:hypothetical protein [Streptomyces sp. NBC_00046]|uniref:hypothetical protein n=1 Tax=Streptomyces sp. NBC_00046 TaxID=2975626 RepID=UPI00324C3E87
MVHRPVCCWLLEVVLLFSSAPAVRLCCGERSSSTLIRFSSAAHNTYVSGKPDSPGYTEEQAGEMARFQMELRQLSIEVATHPYWQSLPVRVRARAAFFFCPGGAFGVRLMGRDPQRDDRAVYGFRLADVVYATPCKERDSCASLARMLGVCGGGMTGEGVSTGAGRHGRHTAPPNPGEEPEHHPLI